MTALTKGLNLTRRGPGLGFDFGGPVAPAVKIWRGAHLAWNAANQLQPVQTAGSVSYAGLSDRDYDNSASSTPGDNVVALRGCYALVVPGYTPADNDLPVYAVDDGTLTLTQNGGAPFLLQAGTVAGIDNGVTFVLVKGAS
jgi:hypothetical protein